MREQDTLKRGRSRDLDNYLDRGTIRGVVIEHTATACIVQAFLSLLHCDLVGLRSWHGFIVVLLGLTMVIFLSDHLGLV